MGRNGTREERKHNGSRGEVGFKHIIDFVLKEYGIHARDEKDRRQFGNRDISRVFWGGVVTGELL
jgi:hypothetical protein